jgi:hypothetical protein
MDIEQAENLTFFDEETTPFADTTFYPKKVKVLRSFNLRLTTDKDLTMMAAYLGTTKTKIIEEALQDFKLRYAKKFSKNVIFTVINEIVEPKTAKQPKEKEESKTCEISGCKGKVDSKAVYKATGKEYLICHAHATKFAETNAWSVP